MVWNILAPIAGGLLTGVMGSSAQKSASRQQAQTAQQGFDAQERMAREALGFQREMLGQQAMAGFPRQQAGNAALQRLTDMYGLGDIYQAPAPGQQGGPAEFYPGTNIFGAQTTQAAMGGAPPAMGGGGQVPNYMAYFNANPDLMQEYNAFATRPGGYGFGPNLPATYDTNRTGRVDPEDYARFHWERFGQAEGRQMPMGVY